MKIIIALMAVAFALAGCTTANEAVKAAAAKNVNASGLLSMQDVQTGYDPVTGSVTPKVLFVTIGPTWFRCRREALYPTLRSTAAKRAPASGTPTRNQ